MFDAERWNWIDVNGNAVRLFGLDRNKPRNKHLIEDLSPPHQPDGRISIEAAKQYMQAALNGEAPVFEWMHRNATGEDILCEIRLIKLPGAGRRLVRASITDISERKRAEEDLREAHAEVKLLKERLEAENIYLQGEIKTEHNFEDIIGNSVQLQKTLKKIEQAAHTGRFELANGGTIFLDEIGELPLVAQVKLLRVLQEQEFERVGGGKSIKVDIRVLAATNEDLESAITEGTFRQDLYYRLNVFPVKIPALRERTGDVPMLVDFFIRRYAIEFGKDLQGVSTETMELLESYTWPGNVRELQNIIERASILSDGPIMKIDHSSFTNGEWGVGRSKLRTLDEVEKEHIVNVLKDTNWIIAGQHGAAYILGSHPNTLRSRMAKLGIQRPSYSPVSK